MRGRTRARQIALKSMFQVDLVEADIDETLEYFEKSNVILVKDIKPVLDEIGSIINQIDPKQIVIVDAI